MGYKILCPLSEKEIKTKTPAKMRQAYLDLAFQFTKITENEVMLCPKCNTFKARKFFYLDKNYNSGCFPICKECLQLMSEQRPNSQKPCNETKESIQKVLRFMDKPYSNKLYESMYKRKMESDLEIKNEDISIFPNYITAINSLPQYQGQTWKDSDFGDSKSIDEEDIPDVRIVKSTVADGRKRFGLNYTDEELMFLETEYKDWIARYECNTKAQEKVFKNLAMIELQKDYAIKKGQPTKDLDKAYQDWLDAGNLKPKQNTMDAFSDAQTFGTLIQKYEEERPLPQIDPELEDVDKIGLYIDVFFKGHLCKVLGIKNRFFNIYDKYMQKYTVSPPQYDEDEDSEAIFEKIFGEKDV